MAHMRLPDLDLNAAAGEVDVDAYFGTIGAQHRSHGYIVEIRIRIKRALIAIAVDGLVEITLAVEQPHADERQAHVARRFAMIAGEYPQSPGVDRQALVETKLGTEIGDQIVLTQPLRSITAQRFFEVIVERQQHPVQVCQEDRIGSGVVELVLVDSLQECLRIMADLFPQFRVEPREEQPGLPVPTVKQVAGKLLQSGEPRREAWINFEGKGCAIGHKGA